MAATTFGDASFQPDIKTPSWRREKLTIYTSEKRRIQEMLTIQCKAILFDFDGTLIDSTPAVEIMWSTWAIQNGIEPKKILASSHGRRTLDVIGMHKPELANMDEVYRVEGTLQKNRQGAFALPNAKALLLSLPDGKWAIATSGTRFHAEGFLKYLDLPHPEQVQGALVTSDQVKNGKPHPESYVTAAERLGVSIEDCVVFEDAPAGIKAGISSGARTISVCTSHRIEEIKGLGQTAIVRDLTSVEVIERDGGIMDIIIINEEQ